MKGNVSVKEREGRNTMKLLTWLSNYTKGAVLTGAFEECGECGASFKSTELEAHMQGCRPAEAAPRKSSRVGTKPRDGKYVSTKHGVSFSCPEDWVIHAEERLETTDTLVVRIGEEETGQAICAASVIVMAPCAREEGGTDRYLRNTEAQHAATFQGFKAHYYKQTQFQGHAAAWMEHSYDNNGARIRELVITAFVEQAFFSLPVKVVFEAPEARYGEGLKAFRRILETFRIADGGLASNINIRIG
jgi:hypothetical protein